MFMIFVHVIKIFTYTYIEDVHGDKTKGNLEFDWPSWSFQNSGIYICKTFFSLNFYHSENQSVLGSHALLIKCFPFNFHQLLLVFSNHTACLISSVDVLLGHHKLTFTYVIDENFLLFTMLSRSIRLKITPHNKYNPTVINFVVCNCFLTQQLHLRSFKRIIPVGCIIVNK